LIEEIELNATGKLDSNNMHEEYSGLDDNAGRMAAYIFIKYKPKLLAVHFAGVDGKQPEHGRDHETLKPALANIDHAIGIIPEAVERSGLKDSITILIVGDHGFADIQR
jgi:predicted AlkP superfamily pyrophosphatase or phosphodiesterase